MAQTGFTPIQLYRTTTASAAPTAGNLADGELAINTTDEKLYVKNAGGAVKLLASTAATALPATGITTSTGTAWGTSITTSAGLAGAISDETGTGSLVFATSPTLVTPNLGTPSALVGTNITGTAAGLTAGNVTTNANLTGEVTSVGNAATLTNSAVIGKVLTGYISGAGTVAATDTILQAIQKLNGNDATNANLTGPITSVGNATSVASQTGTGTKFVMDTSPTLVTPNIGVATGTSFQGIVGNVTPAAGTFTTVTATGLSTFQNDITLTTGTDQYLYYDGALHISKNGTGSVIDIDSSRNVAISGGVTSILANSASAALTVTQTGAGNAFVVEDSASTDSTPFVVTGAGIAVAGHTASIPGAFSDEAIVQSVVAGGTAQFAGFRFSANSGGAIQYFYKSRGATAGANTIVQSGDICGAINFAGADGTTYHRAAVIQGEVDGTPGTNDMPGRLVFSTTADGASSPTERMRIDSSGNVGIGGAAAALNKLRITGTYPASGGFSFVTQADGTFDPATSSSGGYTFYSNPSVAAGSLSILSGYQALAGTFTGTVSTHYGFAASASIIGATTNIGFYSNIASAANRYNFYAAGTAPNYFAGAIGIGAAAGADVSLAIVKGMTGATTTYGVYSGGEIKSDSTASARYFQTAAATQAAVFSVSSVQHYLASQGTFGASSTVDTQYAFHANATLTGATNNYGFYSNIASAANRYNFYAAGTAPNYFAGAISGGDGATFVGNVIAYNGTAIPAGGINGAGYRLSSTSNFGVFFGSGAPTLSSAKGSLYLRSDGSATNNRMYVNTDGGSTWTAVTTAA